MLEESVTKKCLRQLVQQDQLPISLDRKFKRVRLKQKLGGLCLFQSTIYLSSPVIMPLNCFQKCFLILK